MDELIADLAALVQTSRILRRGRADEPESPRHDALLLIHNIILDTVDEIAKKSKIIYAAD